MHPQEYDHEEFGRCDECNKLYHLAERNVTNSLYIRCGECGNCSNCCTHTMVEIKK